MAASSSDYFIKVKDRLTTNLVADKSIGATSMSLDSVEGIPTDTGVIVSVYTLKPDGEIDFETFVSYVGTVSSSTIANLGVVEGIDQEHPTGAFVSIISTAEHWNRLVTGILVSHKQDGTIANGIITPKMLDANASDDWDWETWSDADIAGENFNKGNGVITAKKRRVGKDIEFDFKFVPGGTTTFSGTSSGGQYAQLLKITYPDTPVGLSVNDFVCDGIVISSAIGIHRATGVHNSNADASFSDNPDFAVLVDQVSSASSGYAPSYLRTIWNILPMSVGNSITRIHLKGKITVA